MHRAGGWQGSGKGQALSGQNKRAPSRRPAWDCEGACAHRMLARIMRKSSRCASAGAGGASAPKEDARGAAAGGGHAQAAMA